MFVILGGGLVSAHYTSTVRFLFFPLLKYAGHCDKKHRKHMSQNTDPNIIFYKTQTLTYYLRRRTQEHTSQYAHTILCMIVCNTINIQQHRYTLTLFNYIIITLSLTHSSSHRLTGHSASHSVADNADNDNVSPLTISFGFSSKYLISVDIILLVFVSFY